MIPRVTLTKGGLLLPMLAAGLCSLATLLPLHAQDAPAETAPAPAPAVAAEPAVNAADILNKNASMEEDADGDQWPDHWPKAKSGSTWETEDGNHFIRLSATAPDQMTMMYMEVGIPEGVGALSFSFRQRVADLKVGKNSWFDARVMLEFRDAAGEKLKGSPSAPNTRKNTDGWVEKSTTFLVPEGATKLAVMPALFRVETGTFDIDDMVIASTDPEPVRAEAEAKAAARAEKQARDAENRREKAAATLATNGSLISNGDFEIDEKKQDGWPDHWNRPKGASWEHEDGNHFVRLKAEEPGKLVSLYRVVDIPEGVQALELSFKQRITDLKRGELPWHDARVMLELKDVTGAKMPNKPSPPYSQKSTEGWVEKSVKFLVPEGALSLEIMPALFQVNAGTFDLDNLALTPTEPAPLIAAAAERARLEKKRHVDKEEPKKENWPKPLRVVGNRLHDPDGKEVWLQGMNVASLEWSVRGEQVHKSVIVAIDDWKGNVIRIPVKDDYWFGKEATDGGEGYRAIVDQAIILAANRGAYVVLDLHRYRAPRQEYLKFWTDAATRYKDHPAVIFDLLNEPHGISWEVWRNGGFVEEKRKDGDEDAFLTAEEKLHNKQGFQSPGMQAMLDTVRATGAKNLVLVGGLDYAYELDGVVNGFGLEDKSGNGIIYACHIYPWKSNWQKMLLDAAEQHPILLGEVGADENKMTFMPLEQQEDWETWVPDILALIQKHKLNWTGWCFHPKASPRMLLDWDYTPTPFWGQQAKDALSGKQFEMKGELR